jgi:hypothetical protein
MIERKEEKKAGARVLQPVGGKTGPDQHAGIRKCETCGNEYDKPLEIVTNGISHYFDSFECAIHKLAPTCDHCGCRIIGHGIEAGGTFYCCATCAKHQGVTSVADRA